MRVVQVISVLTACVLAGCGGSDPGTPQAGAGAVAGIGAGVGGTSGLMTAGTGMAGTTAGMGVAGMAAGTGVAGMGVAGTGTMAGAGGVGGEAGMMGTAGMMTAGTGGEPTGSYFPLATGNSWTFRVDEAGVISMKTQTIGPLEMVGGTGPNATKMAYRAETTKDDGGDMTVSWQAEVDNKIVRYREQSFMASTGMLELEEHWDPYKLRVDMTEEHLMVGALWTESYSETKLPVGMAPATAQTNDTWRVVAVDESVTVPAGTFNALVIEKTSTMPKRYWFVRGIGKVKETGTQTEELVSYEVME